MGGKLVENMGALVETCVTPRPVFRKYYLRSVVTWREVLGGQAEKLEITKPIFTPSAYYIRGDMRNRAQSPIVPNAG